LASFTASLRSALLTSGAVTRADVLQLVDESDTTLPRAGEVIGDWARGDEASRERCLTSLSGADAVILQHEFGIFGGADGDEVVPFVAASPVPVVTVLHTVLAEPSPHQREIVDALGLCSAVLVVQSEAARSRLLRAQDVAPGRVRVIPHGAVATGTGVVARRPGARPTVLTWGLVGPGKGIEHGIRAVARLRDRVPAVVYRVVGDTHPKVKAREGDRYRESLERLTAELGLADHVEFDATYHATDALRAMAAEADVVLLPYESRDQVTSGVLVEALAAGVPVVATAFPHASEALAGGAGFVVPYDDDIAMASALGIVLADAGVAARMRMSARETARGVLWPVVADAYYDVIANQVAVNAA
jgi:glycosyltransferase involved in cell wall biosynthesis